MKLSALLPNSLAYRVIGLSSIWAIVALVAIATIISSLFRQASERGFESLLTAHMFNLISAVSLTEQGLLVGAPNLGDLRFSEPGSGWYWSVTPASEGVAGELRSLSMYEAIESPPSELIPFDTAFERSYRTEGIEGETLDVFESEFVLGSDNRIARFRMMGNRTELEDEIDAFDRQLYTYLTLFGLGMIAINAMAILLGLKPLSGVRRSLAEIRRGKASRLDGSFPREIAPLVEETNALIENNRRIVERARTQVGNLAHSLKTPLAVMLNEGRTVGGAKGTLMTEQARAMQEQIDHYLQKARIAAQRDSVVFRTPVAPALERLMRVGAKLGRDKDVALDMPDRTLIFAGEREDLEEMVGNLLENALKWSKGAVVIRALPLADAGLFALEVEDDGPGIPQGSAGEALRRGVRLDETKPGTGLGLAIVADLVREYGGGIELLESRLGGLRARLTLRRAPA